MGIVNWNTEYLTATTDEIISCSTVCRLPDNEAYDKKCINEIIVKYADYVKTGSRTAPIALRFTPTSKEIAPDPHPIPTTFVPCVAYFKPKDFATHAYIGDSKGCEYLATGIGSRKNHSIKCILRMEELLADNEEGQQRCCEAVERKEHC